MPILIKSFQPSIMTESSTDQSGTGIGDSSLGLSFQVKSTIFQIELLYPWLFLDISF